MADYGSGPGWSETQWQKVSNAISEEFSKASVVSQFLPCYGPLGGSAEAVREERLKFEDGVVSVTDDTTLKLFTLRALVQLSNQQIAEEELTSAILAFRRAANALALAQDDVVFNGYGPGAARGGVARRDTPDLVPNSPERVRGLESHARSNERQKPATSGDDVVTRVATAITELEARSHSGPFACVLGHRLFVAVHESDSDVLPVDRIKPMLNGPLLRSSRLNENRGLVVSQASGGIDLVVGTPPRAQFLNVTDDAKSIFRVYVRFALRVKEEANPPIESFTFADGSGLPGGRRTAKKEAKTPARKTASKTPPTT